MSEIKKRRSATSTAETYTDNEVKIHRKEDALSGKTSLRILSRIVVITSLLIVVYISTKHNGIKTFAKQAEHLPGKGQIVECSKSYMNEVDIYEGCFPKDCKRYVTDTVVSKQEAKRLLNIAKKGLKFGGSSGGASILDLHSGALSMGQHFVNIYKKPDAQNVFTEEDFTLYRVVKDKIKFELAQHFGANPNKLYLTHPTFFSQITARKAVTIHDEYWHPHVDKETYKSFHYTTLLYLGDYSIDFKGGRFVFVDEKHNYTIEPRSGRISMFTSGAENLHYVEKVESGIRYAMTISFTCDKKYAIVDPSINKYSS